MPSPEPERRRRRRLRVRGAAPSRRAGLVRRGRDGRRARPRRSRRCGCGCGCGRAAGGRRARDGHRRGRHAHRGHRAAAARLAGLPRLLGHDPALGARRDALVVPEVLGGRVGLLRLVEGQVERLVDHLPAVQVRPVDERDRDARGAGAAGAADAVHVGLVVLGAGVVDDVGDAGDVDAAGGDVGGDQHLQLVLAEPGQRLLARDLGHVAVQGVALEAALLEVVGDPLGLPLGAGEDDHLAGVLGLEDPPDHLGLVEVVGEVDELRGRGHHRGVVGRLGADVHRVPHVAAGQRDDRGGHGRREQHRLPGLGGLREQLLDVGQEAEVEHLVGLVEDERVHVGQVEGAAVGQVDQAARRTDDDVDALRQRVELGLVAHSAVDGEDAQPEVLAGQGQVAGDLERQLTGRGDDERLRLALGHLAVVRVLRRDAALHHRDAEGQRLAGARAGLADQVGAQQGDREGHLLDREGGGDAGALERVTDIGEHPELSERGQGLVAFV